MSSLTKKDDAESEPYQFIGTTEENWKLVITCSTARLSEQIRLQTRENTGLETLQRVVPSAEV
jgi:hypothetical protein